MNSYVPGKDTRVEVGGTANAKADNTDLGVYKSVLTDQHIPTRSLYQSLTTILGSNEGSTRVAVTRAFSGGGRTDHIVRDVMVAVSVLTSALRCHGQVDPLQGGVLVAC